MPGVHFPENLFPLNTLLTEAASPHPVPAPPLAGARAGGAPPQERIRNPVVPPGGKGGKRAPSESRTSD